MNNLTDIRYVKDLQANLRVTFDSPNGKEIMDFLEKYCGWYESIFDPVDKDYILVKAGRREVIATIKTLLKLSPEEVVTLVKESER